MKTKQFFKTMLLLTITMFVMVQCKDDEPELEPAKLAVAPMNIDFGQVEANKTVVKDVTISNSGGESLKINSINLEGDNKSEFSVNGKTGEVKSGKSYSFKVEFKPIKKGSKKAKLVVKSNVGSETVALVGSCMVKAAKMEVSVKELKFGAVKQNTKKEMTFTVKNTGDATLKVTKLSINGTDKAMFSQNAGASFNLEKGKTKKVKVTFTPTSKGDKSAKLTFNGGGVEQEIALTGRGIAKEAKMEVSVNKLEFGAVKQNIKKEMTFTIKNVGEATLKVTKFSISGTDKAMFSQNAGASFDLKKGKTKKVKVTFTPTSKGDKFAKLTFNGGGINQEITLTGSGIAKEAKMIVSKSKLDFGTVKQGVKKEMTFTVKNEGEAVLEVTKLAISGTNADMFSQDAEISFSLKKGKVKTIKVSFLPNSAGSKSAKLTFTGAGENKTITLMGSGEAKVGELKVSPDSADLGSVKVGEQKQVTLKLENIGEKKLTVSKLAFSGSAASNFSTTATTPKEIEPGNYIQITVTFKPSSKGSKSAKLTITTDVGNKEVDLSGSGTLDAASIDLSTTNLDFGEIEQKTSKTLTFKIKNNGGEKLHIKNLSISGTDKAMFKDDAPANFNISGGSSRTVKVTFTPTSKGSKSAAVTIKTGNATHTVNLVGVGKKTPGKVVFEANNSANYYYNAYGKNIYGPYKNGSRLIHGFRIKNIGDKSVWVRSIKITKNPYSQVSLGTTGGFWLKGHTSKLIRYALKATQNEGTMFFKIEINTDVGKNIYTSRRYIEEKLQGKITDDVYNKLFDKHPSLIWGNYDVKNLDTYRDGIISLREARQYKGLLYLFYINNWGDEAHNPFKYFPDISALFADFKNDWNHLKPLKRLKKLYIKGSYKTLAKAMWKNNNKPGLKNIENLRFLCTSSDKFSIDKAEFPKVTTLYISGYGYPDEALSKQIKYYTLVDSEATTTDEVKAMTNLKSLYTYNCKSLKSFFMPSNYTGSGINVKVENCSNIKKVYVPKGIYPNPRKWGISTNPSIHHYN